MSSSNVAETVTTISSMINTLADFHATRDIVVQSKLGYTDLNFGQDYADYQERFGKLDHQSLERQWKSYKEQLKWLMKHQPNSCVSTLKSSTSKFQPRAEDTNVLEFTAKSAKNT